MRTTWSREEIPYDAMGDYSMFVFEKREEAGGCENPDRNDRDQG